MPPKAAPKKKAANGYKLAAPIPKGEILEDVAKKKWRLGISIGHGGFGEIYEAQPEQSKSKDYPYVIKIEPHTNGPLFVEMHFYIRNAKEDDIEKFKADKGLKSLGVPVFVGSGSHEYKNEKYRFLVMEKFGTDLWKIFLEHDRIFPQTTVFKIAIQLLDILEYIHSRGYVHADIKGANILMGTTKSTQNKQVYLVDFGLATKYSNNSVFKPNPKKAHDGTIEYLSRDAHQGVPTMRGDLEVLVYNLITWLGCTLPWEKNLLDPNSVQKSKEEHMENDSKLLEACFVKQKAPEPLKKFLTYLKTLEFKDVPDYQKIRNIFLNGMDSGDALGKPFVFDVAAATKPKTQQKRKNNKTDKSPSRKVTKKTDQISINSDDEDDISAGTKKTIQNSTEGNVDGNVDIENEQVAETIPSNKVPGRRGQPKINYKESPTHYTKKPAIKQNRKKINKNKNVTPKIHVTGDNNGYEDNSDSDAELTKEETFTPTAAKKIKNSSPQPSTSLDGYTDAMKEVLAKKLANADAKKNKARIAKKTANNIRKKKVTNTIEESDDDI